jgi:hypothetical protein
MMRESNRKSPTTSHSKRSLVTTERTSEATISRTTTAETQRPTWRTGIALIASGGGPAAGSPAEPAGGSPAGSEGDLDRVVLRLVR